MNSKILRRPTVLKAILILSKEGQMNLNALAMRLGTNRYRLKKYLDELVSEGAVEVVSSNPRVYKLKGNLNEIIGISTME